MQQVDFKKRAQLKINNSTSGWPHPSSYRCIKPLKYGDVCAFLEQDVATSYPNLLNLFTDM